MSVCVFCSGKHDGPCPVLAARKAAREAPRVAPPRKRPPEAGPMVVVGRDDPKPLGGDEAAVVERPKAGFDRGAYQREYMRGWRKRKKVESP